MITIFSTCRPFENKEEDWNTIQRNAIISWTKLNPKPQIILMGDEGGTKEICEEFDLLYIPNVELSEHSTAPIIKSMIEIAENLSQNNTLLLLCSDNIIFQSTIRATQVLEEKQSPFCGCVIRHQLSQENRNKICFDGDYETNIKKLSNLGNANAGDYILFSRGFWHNLPPFIMGRASHDNWMFWEANNRKQLVNMTASVSTIHQVHNYSHMGGLEKFIHCEEININRKLAGDQCNGYQITQSHLKMNSNFEV